jgi:hypothetical protein
MERLVADGNLDIFQFLELVQKTWSLIQERKSSLYVDGKGYLPAIKMYEAFPSAEEINPSLPVVTYEITSKMPTKEIKPRIRETFVDKNDPDKIITVTGQRFIYQVEFTAWGRTNSEVNKIINELEDFMFLYTGLFKRKGVAEVLYHGYSAELVPNKPNYFNDQRAKTSVYSITIESLRMYDSQIIKEIEVEVEKMNLMEEET